jgi:hypothetical protein
LNGRRWSKIHVSDESKSPLVFSRASRIARLR